MKFIKPYLGTAVVVVVMLIMLYGFLLPNMPDSVKKLFGA